MPYDKLPNRQAPNLLNDDGTASIATAVMMSHHGLRRDLARFASALDELARGASSTADALREEWTSYRNTLHGHHEAEDQGLFPSLASAHESVRQTIERLGADHRLIDPLLERGDAAFAALPDTKAARSGGFGAHDAALAAPCDGGSGAYPVSPPREGLSAAGHRSRRRHVCERFRVGDARSCSRGCRSRARDVA